jgi:hypothetical protein
VPYKPGHGGIELEPELDWTVKVIPNGRKGDDHGGLWHCNHAQHIKAAHQDCVCVAEFPSGAQRKR